jgi:hypothetical protein
MVLYSSCDGVPLKFEEKKQAGLQFTSTNYLSLVLTPLRICWTVPLSEEHENGDQAEARWFDVDGVCAILIQLYTSAEGLKRVYTCPGPILEIYYFR